jgi:cell division protein FtsI/penicillin-binding protein 2
MKRAKKITKAKNPAQTAFTRFMLVVAFFILWIGAIGVRLVHLQVNQSEWLRERAQDQRRDELKSRMLRGTIYDRSERALAMSVKVKSLYADPREIEDVEATARDVAAALKIKPDQLLKDLREGKEANKRFVWLAQKLDEDAAQQLNKKLETYDLKKFDAPKYKGLHWREEQKRSYPYKNLAAQIVGFSNADDIGQAGIEQSQEEILRGAVVKKWQDRDRLGRVYEEQEATREPPKDIVLTISHSIQYKVEQALEKGAKASNAKSGMAIVLDPRNGEILAMANYPSFDPNRYTEFPAENYQNKAIQAIYSPGSVFKLITYGAALDSNLMTADGMIDCSRGFIEVAGHRFNDPHATKTMSYVEAMAVSSNVAAIKTGMSLGKENFYLYAQKFGFGQPTGVELPAEARGLFRSPETWNGDSLASMSIGYEVGVTAMQMVSAYAAIANGGVRVKPHIIKEIRHSGGKPAFVSELTGTPIVSQDAARGLKKMLREVVVKGTAKRAQLNGYTSAGKTGTAWKYNAKLRRVDAGKYVSSFIGMAPAENPAVVILVVMDEPQGGARDGGQVSAPVFREIAEGILPEMNVVPDASYLQEDLTAQTIPSEIEEVVLPETEEQKSDETPKTESKKSIEKVGVSESLKVTKRVEKQIKSESKKENKSPNDDKKLSKPKPLAVNTKAKNKSSTERVKKKT